jgi:hypothetical protein
MKERSGPGALRAMRAQAAVLLMIVPLVGFLARVALADSRVAFLAERLKYPPTVGQVDDFRVRTNAALALGATKDDGAIAPLCDGLGDPSEVVRQAVAVALKRLSKASSIDCLHRRYPVETNAAVKLQIQRAIEATEASGKTGAGATDPVLPYVATARYYVSISPIANGTSRPSTEVERVVREAIASRLGQLGEYQVAPTGESTESAKATLTKRRLKGYFLGVSMEKFDYSEGNLRVRIKIAVFSYPGRDLRGEVPAGATLPGARPGDQGAEDQLMSVVAARAAELFAQNFK